MMKRPATFERFVEASRDYLRQHWQRALRVRERLWLSEEAFHLLLASVVGLMGGVINVLFYLAIEGVQDLMVGHPGQTIVQVARELDPRWRLLTPALGGLAAGAVLYWGVRLIGTRRPTNLL